MPTYTYKCTACDDVIEKRQSFSDPPLTTCDQCGGALRKVIHPVGIVFKGSGWYITDSRSSSGTTNGRTNASGDSGSSSESKDAPKTETSSTTPNSDSGSKTESSSAASKSGSKSESSSTTSSTKSD